jgi:rod shape-determining protein MreD
VKLRRSVATVVIVIIAAALQTTMFATVRPFDAAPALVLLVVIAFARHVPAEAALLLGFGAGLLQDLLAESALGLWALVFTTVAYAVIRFRDRLEDDFSLLGPFVFGLTVGGLALFSVLGTIFGEKTLADVGLIKKILLPSLYNMILAAIVLPFATWVLGATRRRSSPFQL